MANHHWPADGHTRGTVLLVHGLTASSDTWWQVGPALAARGFDVSAIDQAGHGDRPLAGPVDLDVLMDAVLGAVPTPPDVLLGHSLGALTALHLLDRHPGWAGTVVLEDPPCTGDVAPAQFLGAVAAGVVADGVAVRTDRASVVRRIRTDCPRWDDRDVEHAVRGIERTDTDAFATWLAHADQEAGALDTAARIVAVRPTPHVLAARGAASYVEGGSAIDPVDLERLRATLPDGHLVEIDGGHCLHRDDPEAWLDAVERAASA